ncbi:UDP-glucose 4-epimerase GalE [Streptomyces radicis]|uniref:UDP-glucose 4-epimerase n=1 Tax=Streptomyces radicis TaxID=1750517 RepID=A0A3A9WC52_9ACTN|nr:UDP-glucose 4-epimerase GalE [Streptomyces radicis]RKN10575.1 UDP-glucose 4-epimerase GalE [Streptomyces radicis]RKN24835.1 UDP-glucose 4-epimerase GalE [Streptomyces radicis]
MTWLITGGAGYIGAHVVEAMRGAGQPVVVLDDLSTGVATRLGADVPLVTGSVLDRPLLDETLERHAVTGVVHLAAKKQVGDSVAEPLLYYRENVHGLTVLLQAVAAAGVRRFVFSSSAAVYGTPEGGTGGVPDLVTEQSPCRPVSPYGETKLAGEWLVRAAGRAHGIATVCLRYFNVAGAARPELVDTGAANVIPMFFERIARGERPEIFGDDYPTPDGTCVRDYVHVADLARAHLVAARHLAAPAAGAPGDLTVNVGTGRGVSVRELAERVAEVTGHPELTPRVTARRQGDPARVVASADLARERLGFTARRDLGEMVSSAWEGWRLLHP